MAGIYQKWNWTESIIHSFFFVSMGRICIFLQNPQLRFVSELLSSVAMENLAALVKASQNLLI